MFAIQRKASPFRVIKFGFHLTEGKRVVALHTTRFSASVGLPAALSEHRIVRVAVAVQTLLRLAVITVMQSPQPTRWIGAVTLAMTTFAIGLLVRPLQWKSGPELVIECGFASSQESLLFMAARTASLAAIFGWGGR